MSAPLHQRTNEKNVARKTRRLVEISTPSDDLGDFTRGMRNEVLNREASIAPLACESNGDGNSGNEFDRMLRHEDFGRLLAVAAKVKAIHTTMKDYTTGDINIDTDPQRDQIQETLLLMRNHNGVEMTHLPRGTDPIIDSLIYESIKDLNKELQRSLAWTSSGKKVEGGDAIAVKYSKRQTDLLTDWMILHRSHPFPDASQIRQLSTATGLSYSQVVNWTTNVRKRNLKATVEGGKKPHHFLDFLFLAEDREKRFNPNLAKEEQAGTSRSGKAKPKGKKYSETKNKLSARMQISPSRVDSAKTHRGMNSPAIMISPSHSSSAQQRVSIPFAVPYSYNQVTPSSNQKKPPTRLVQGTAQASNSSALSNASSGRMTTAPLQSAHAHVFQQPYSERTLVSQYQSHMQHLPPPPPPSSRLRNEQVYLNTPVRPVSPSFEEPPSIEVDKAVPSFEDFRPFSFFGEQQTGPRNRSETPDSFGICTDYGVSTSPMRHLSIENNTDFWESMTARNKPDDIFDYLLGGDEEDFENLLVNENMGISSGSVSLVIDERPSSTMEMAVEDEKWADSKANLPVINLASCEVSHIGKGNGSEDVNHRWEDFDDLSILASEFPSIGNNEEGQSSKGCQRQGSISSLDMKLLIDEFGGLDEDPVIVSK